MEIFSAGIVFNYDGLSEFLKQVAEYEKGANAKVEKQGLLKDLLKEVIKKAGQSIKFHKGFREFFQKMVKNENPTFDVHVISYCWCGNLIRSAFSPGINMYI